MRVEDPRGCALVLIALAVFWIVFVWVAFGPDAGAEEDPPSVCIAGQTLEADGTGTTLETICSTP